jgi:hypothetical protein
MITPSARSTTTTSKQSTNAKPADREPQGSSRARLTLGRHQKRRRQRPDAHAASNREVDVRQTDALRRAVLSEPLVAAEPLIDAAFATINA